MMNILNLGECSDQRFFERRKTFEREKAETITKWVNFLISLLIDVKVQNIQVK